MKGYNVFMLLRCLTALVIAGCATPAVGEDTASGYAGSEVCGKCHPAQFESQSKTAHAHALRPAQTTDPGPGSHSQWAFGAGTKAITWVSQTGEETIAEHNLSYYAATKSLASTPGHPSSSDLVYRTFDPVTTGLRCFRCHSTGPITLGAKFQIQPSESGVHCESCHGPGRAHAESRGAAAIQNPKRLSAVQMNTLCGACHRQESQLDDETDWSNAWNVRHQPSYLHRAACFRNSDGALSCLTCHDPHQPLKTAASAYDARCMSCHPKAAHTAPIAARSCIGCHMPQVTTSANLKFTNHWIGIYDPHGRNLIPSKRAVTDLHPVLAKDESASGMIVPADPSTLVPVYAQAMAERQRESGPDSAKAARAAADFGRFLLQIEKSAEAEAPLQRAVALDEHNSDPAIDADRESLALAFEAQSKSKDTFEL